MFSKSILKSLCHGLFMSAAVITVSVGFSACSDDPDTPVPPQQDVKHGVFVVCEGNYGSSNSSLSWANMEENSYMNEIFRKANGVPLGSQAQSMTIHDENGWVVVTDSHIIFKIGLDDWKEKGRVTGIDKPRYMHFVSDTKAYVTMMNSSRIAVVDPTAYTVTGYIDIPDLFGSGDAAMMVQDGKYVYVNCWSYQNRIVRIDTDLDEVDASLVVGVQPKEMVMDRDKNLWVVTDGGGWEQNPAGYETPALVKIDAGTMSVAKRFELTAGANVGSIAIDGKGQRLYWVCNDVYSMTIDSDTLPDKPVIKAFEDNSYRLYGLGVSPVTGHVYVADAKDYSQNGAVLEYDSEGVLLHSFDTGICPRFFCWYEQ